MDQIDSSNNVLWLHHDQLGSTRLITDGTGTVKATYSYDPYGNLTASTGTVNNPFQFAGEYKDSESGLYNLRARMYDPVTGQFMSRDPAVALTRSGYAYVQGNPLNGADPSGMFSLGDVGGWVHDRTSAVANSGVGQFVGGAFDAGTSEASNCGGAFRAGQVVGRLVGDAAITYYLFRSITGKGLSGASAADDGSGVLSQTVHGADRALDPSRLDAGAQSNVIANATQTFTQFDGAQVFVQSVGGKFNVVVQGQNGTVTNLKAISQASLDRLAKNYGWTPN